MNAASALVMAIAGGFFGTLGAITISFFAIRYAVKTSIDKWIEGPHERNECPVCKQPMKHK